MLVIKVPKEELDKSLNLVECRVEKIGYFCFKETILFPTSQLHPALAFLLQSYYLTSRIHYEILRYNIVSTLLFLLQKGGSGLPGDHRA